MGNCISKLLHAGAVVIVLAAAAGLAWAQPGLAGVAAMVDRNELAPALAALDKMIAAEPSNGPAYAQRARVRYFQHDIAAARADAGKALSLNPRDAIALNIRGMCEAVEKNFSAAIRDFSAALDADPQFLKALRNRATTRADNGEPLDAFLKDYDDFLKLNPSDAAVYRLAGDNCLKRAGGARCVSYFGKLKDLQPANAIGYLGSAMAYGNLPTSKVDRSILKGQVTDDFKKAIELDPKNAFARVQYGRLLYNLGEYAASIEPLTRAIELDPKDPKAPAMRGDAHRQAGKFDLAAADYKRSIELKRDQPAVHRYLGDSLKALGRWGEMFAAYQNAVEYDDYNRDAYERLTTAFYMSTDWIPRASAYYESLVAKKPGNVCALEALGRRYSGSKERQILDRAIAGFDGKNGKLCSANAAFWLGRVHSEKYGEANTAMDYYETALRIDPTLPYVRDWMSKISRSNGRRNGAVAESVRTQTNRQAYVDTTYLNASNEIKRRSDQFNAYNKESLNTLDTTPARQRELNGLMITEMTAIVDLAKRTMSDIGSEISQSGRDYLNRIITTGTQRLNTLQR